MSESKRTCDFPSVDDKTLKKARSLKGNEFPPEYDQQEFAQDYDPINPPTPTCSTAKVLDTIRRRTDIRSSLVNLDYQRVYISDIPETPDEDTVNACRNLQEAMRIREKWINCLTGDLNEPPALTRRPSVMTEITGEIDTLDLLPAVRYTVLEREQWTATKRYHTRMVHGVMKVILTDDGAHTNISDVPSFEEFLKDFTQMRRIVYTGPTVSFCYSQLELLMTLFDLHLILNKARELDASRLVPYRDFYNTRKVDTHVHHSACMNQTHLLKFIKNKLSNHCEDVVICRDGKQMTLAEVFDSLHLSGADLSIDTLDMHAHNTFFRFDRFNLKYNPAGQSMLREIFLKTDNFMHGRYLAELTKEVIADLEKSKYSLAEWRLSVYGTKENEWSILANWFYSNKLASENVRWMIQVPRLFDSYRAKGIVNNFEELLHNIFQPLFDVTLNPASDIALSYFLDTIVGFDSVDDESRPEFGALSAGAGSLPQPHEWVDAVNPPYGYWLYYMYANICALNQLRQARGMSTFQFRPHCGEAGDADHLISAYLLANQINHGIRLRKIPALQFLFYLSQVGIAMSPLSNNKLFLPYNKNPFPVYFKQGLNVSLSTDDPLLLHCTADPLVEEYSIATQVWKLSPTDQCEIARNSVLQSGIEDEYKQHFLGEGYKDVCRTNVPMIRITYREETHSMMMDNIQRIAQTTTASPMA